MRQVDLDELTYQIYSGLRSWTPSVRQRVFAPPHKRHPFTRGAAADQVCGKLKLWEFLDPADGHRRLLIGEVSARFQEAMDAFPGAIQRLWISGQREREKEAHAAATILLARSLGSLEVLSPTSLDHHGIRIVTFPTVIAPDYAFRPSWP